MRGRKGRAVSCAKVELGLDDDLVRGRGRGKGKG